MARNNEIALFRRGNNALALRPESQESYVTPAVDTFETADSFILTLDLPGTRKDAIQLSVEPTNVIVRAKVEPYHKEDANLLVNETVSKSYYRSFNLGDGIDYSRVQAEFDGGVLTVSLPKTESMRTREITIK